MRLVSRKNAPKGSSDEDDVKEGEYLETERWSCFMPRRETSGVFGELERRPKRYLW